MAPQMVHPDPALALAKVRSVPRGRVPIFLVGDAADEPRMGGLADGFFVRPVAPDALLERARAVLTAPARTAVTARRRRTTTGEDAVRRPPAPGVRAGHPARPAAGRTGRPAVLKPLKARVAANAPRRAADPAAGGRRERAAREAERRHRRRCSRPTCRARWRSAPRIAHGAPRASGEFDDMPTDDRRQRSASDERRGAAGALRAGRGGRLLRGAGRRARRERRRHPARARPHRARAGARGDRAGAGTELGAKLDAIREVVGEALRVLGDEHAAAALHRAPAVRTLDAMAALAGGVLRLARVRGAVAARGRRRHGAGRGGQPARPSGRARAGAGAAGGEGRGGASWACRSSSPRRCARPRPQAALAAFAADLFVVVAYGRILPQRAARSAAARPLQRARSLLPKLRGAAPIQWSIIRGDSETGVSIMRMEAGLDTGPVAAVRALPIADDDTAGTLSEKLAELGAGLLRRDAARDRGRARHAGAAGRRARDAGAAADEGGRPPDFDSAGARRLGAGARRRSVAGRERDAGRRAAEAVRPARRRRLRRGPAGRGAAACAPEGLAIACAGGAIAFAELQMPGRRRLPAAAVLAGHRIPAGTVLA